ncbi:hypothetical protein DEO72_LG9g2034 [Vigna unguiculata]|uniref:Uncharacterized protein n=1 Tax=Vigna unguiculata TaxID=3917 RepID=A0A4D6N3E0_VIGUN|nr:hypothetical protein DEO72_LG9g2034 [Vigna unguiculata]
MLITIHEPTRSWHNISRSKHHRLKATQTSHRLLNFRPAHHPAPPGETGPDRLAERPHRQAPDAFQTHYFPDSAWLNTHCRQAPTQYRASHTVAIAWRLTAARQVPYQRHFAAGFGTPI